MPPLIVTVPCDSPFLPYDLVARLATARSAIDADVAVARTGSQPHPVFALVCTRVRSHLADFLARGERKIDPGTRVSTWSRSLSTMRPTPSPTSTRAPNWRSTTNPEVHGELASMGFRPPSTQP